MTSRAVRKPNIDLHCHSTESDGVLPPAAVVREAVQDGVTVLALTDHDTLTGIPAARAAADEYGIEFVAGIELSCRHGRESVHLLGLFLDPEDRTLTEVLEEIRQQRRQRIRKTCEQLQALGLPITFEEVSAISTGSSIGRPHVADALVRKGLVRNRNEAFVRYLADGKPGRVPEGTKVSVADGVRLLRGAGAVTSIAHPKFLDDQEMLIPMLREAEVEAIEAFHVEQSVPEREHYLTIADSLGLLVSGGSDFHERKNGKRFGSELPPERYEELRAAAR